MALSEIVAYKKEYVDKIADQILARKNELVPSRKSLFNALKSPGLSFICEVKKASPSRGDIKKGADVLDIATIYGSLASAISVLADEKYFGGSPKDVARVSRLAKLAVLFKDVVVSPLQIYQARLMQADAVLLMLSVLDDEAYRECARIAQTLSLDVICEVHSEQELDRAIKLGPEIIGINNRDLKTLQIDFATTEKLLAKIPKGPAVISESGFSTRQHVRRYLGLVDGVLVGTALMKADRIDLALRELMFGRVKICGLTNNADAKEAYNSGATFGGLNFSAQSPRRVSLEDAKVIVKEVPLLWGGVFVDQSIDEVAGIARALDLQFVQLHGSENDEYLRDLRIHLPGGCQIWQALRVKDRIPSTSNYADRVLLDAFRPGQVGGTGCAFDWDLLKNFPHRDKIILAGGINESTVVAADACGAWALDIASGAEEGAPRKKSPEAMKRIFAKLKGA